jgi:hypothetical protein
LATEAIAATSHRLEDGEVQRAALTCSPLALLSLIVCAIAAAPACSKDDPAYCPDRPNNYCACRSDADCVAPAAVCEIAATNTCVECTADNAAACTGTRPVCGADLACRGCAAHADCASAACLEDGACAAAEEVAYVSPAGTDNEQCTQAAPCTRLTKALATLRPYVKLSGTTSESVTITDGRRVTLLAEPGARLRGSSPTAPILNLQGAGTAVTIVDLTISDAPNDQNGYGVLAPAGLGTVSLSLLRATIANNPAGGIHISNGALKLTRSVIRGNAGGGVTAANTVFDITNTFFFANGNQSSFVGGLSVTAPQNAANRLEHNSFNKNQTTDGYAPAVQCGAGVFTARNNILSGNGTLTQLTQYSGSCQHAYSIVTPGALPGGSGNSAVDPRFVNTATGDLHLSPASPARDAADPSTALTGALGVDFDGQPRTAPADVGADELP